jgi:predicted DNA-binding helix-hairpin-helix protein
MKGICNTFGEDARFDSSGCILKDAKLPFVYPAKGEGVRYLFKVLLTNKCENNCLYCINRKDANQRRYVFSPRQLAEKFMEYHKRGTVNGLFLSSGIYKSPDRTQERIIETIRLVRERYNYKGYIHTKILPGVSPQLVEEAIPFSDRISINLEAPGEDYLSRLSGDKNFARLISILREISKRKGTNFSITTQFVVGAAGENDLALLKMAERLYGNFGLSRVYYSGFSPQPSTPLSGLPPCPTHRIRRLYQADFLVRGYNFKPKELAPSGLLPDIDPKFNWAESHPEKFPVEINKASYDELIRVPGIGPIIARRIIKVRREGRITSFYNLKRMGVKGEKILDFITLNGRYQGEKYRSLDLPKQALID